MKNKTLLILTLLLCNFQYSIFNIQCSMVNAQRVMTLDECIAAARTGNTRAKDAQNDILMAKEQQKYARSKYFPMLGASAFHFESTDDLFKLKLLDDETEQDIASIFQEAGLEFDSSLGLIKRGTSVGLTMIEPLYTGGRLTNYNRLADLQVDARRMLQDVADDEIVMSTEFLYYKVLELHELDKTLEDAVKASVKFNDFAPAKSAEEKDSAAK